MSHVFSVRNVNQAFKEAWWWLRTVGERAQTRNGPVVRAPGVIITEYSHPRERILWSPRRDANPVFHLAECVWMMAGSKDVEWLTQFNSRISQYADRDGDIHGAYGYRWRTQWFDQLYVAIDLLEKDPDSRQVVIQMWDAYLDLGTQHNDRPCNTHIYLETPEFGGVRQLDMTVCCRSNDMLWGAYGSNVVHFSFLQEVLAHELKVNVGVYRQVSNNFHVYTEVPGVSDFLHNPPHEDFDEYGRGRVKPDPILIGHESLSMLTADCEAMIATEVEDIDTDHLSTRFAKQVAHPLMLHYVLRKKDPGKEVILHTSDWALAYIRWLERRK